jgi:TIGR03009 family protein
MMRNLGKRAALVSLMMVGAIQPSEAQQGQTMPAGQPAAQPPQPGNANPAPFILSRQEQATLDQFLRAWEEQSKGTKRLEAKFRRWHYDLLAAPAGVHSTWAEGVIKYGAPDKGLFRVDQLKFFGGIVDDKPTYAAQEGQFGEHWVCNGQELLEFDHRDKTCKIQQLPPEMRGKEIFESPLPFVFNLDAAKIKDRYWVRQIQAQPEVVVIEAHPKYQVDRAQYKFVRIVVNATSFLPQALILYSPNFDEVKAPEWDHYEFIDVERNSMGSGMVNWIQLFINERPPAGWKEIREPYRPDPQLYPQTPPQVAQPPQKAATIR